jgi:dolichol-phosphate mannosyltransferase
MVKLSVVMPAYNEAAHIEQCVVEWHDHVVSRVPHAELVVVDDCSTDDTKLRLDGLTARLPGLRVLQTPVNVGHGPALRLGLDRSMGEFVFQTDSDRQHTPEDFWLMWSEREAADFVFGSRRQRADGAFRRIVSTAMRAANLAMWGIWIRDANCPFKLMRGDALRTVLSNVPPDSFIPMVMVSILARRAGFRVREVAVRHFPRIAGHQSLKGLLKWGTVGPHCLRELLALRTAESRRSRPGRHGADRLAGHISRLH